MRITIEFEYDGDDFTDHVEHALHTLLDETIGAVRKDHADAKTGESYLQPRGSDTRLVVNKGIRRMDSPPKWTALIKHRIRDAEGLYHELRDPPEAKPTPYGA